MLERKYDLILYGASGFTGRQTVDYCRRFAPPSLRWAIAGRNRDKLNAVNRPGVDVLIADSQDDGALDVLASQARVVATTAGPFGLYGTRLVDACVRNRTHYCDITGETPWVRRLIDRYHEQARADGTRIVPGCGFDSIPSDFGAWLTYGLMPDCQQISAYFRMAGGINGGTMATALHQLKSGEEQQAADPFLLDPDPASYAPADRARHADPSGARFDDDVQAWVTPFIMGPINTRVVRRTQALLLGNGAAYGYQEFMKFESAAMARVVDVGGVLYRGVASSAFGRWMIKPLLPAPGEGPSDKTMDTGFFECEFVGRNAAGKRIRTRMRGDGDPGNRITVKCLCESAFVLAEVDGSMGGILTPVAGLGSALVSRLAHRGIRFSEGFSEGDSLA